MSSADQRLLDEDELCPPLAPTSPVIQHHLVLLLLQLLLPRHLILLPILYLQTANYPTLESTPTSNNDMLKVLGVMSPPSCKYNPRLVWRKVEEYIALEAFRFFLSTDGLYSKPLQPRLTDKQW